MPVDLAELVADLAEEHAALDAVVAPLGSASWSLPTPSPGWTVADQIGHLAHFDGTAAQAIEAPEDFVAGRDDLLGAVAAGASMDELTLAAPRSLSPADLLAAWRAGRTRLLGAAATLAAGDRVGWYGPSMGARSFLTARLMETWAHGQDVVDAVSAAGLRAARPVTDRLRHVAQLGVITRGWSYANRHLTAPEVDVRVDLDAPSGGRWTWGDPAAESVRGPAEDFCLVVTQRRHVDDTALVVLGASARDWMLRAQAFAGAPTDGPAPRIA